MKRATLPFLLLLALDLKLDVSVESKYSRGAGIADKRVLNTKPPIQNRGNMKRHYCLFAEQINMVLLLTFRYSPEGEDGE